jgi:hypothetical protein
MKFAPFFAFLLLFLASCHVSRQTGHDGAASKAVARPVLKQKLPSGRVSGVRQPHALITRFCYRQAVGARPEVLADFQFRGRDSLNRTDAVLYFILDGEKIKLAACRAGTSVESSSAAWAARGDQPTGICRLKAPRVKLSFLVPENLWVSIANIKEMHYRLVFGKQATDVFLNQAETNQVRQFFGEAAIWRDAAFPQIPANPPGLKKW